MNTLLTNITELFAQLIDNPDKADEIALKIKDLLNEELGNDRNFKPVECTGVFVSKSNANDPFYIIAVPTMPITGNTILSMDFIYSYNIDIDLDSIMKETSDKARLTANELAAWFMHEMYANVLTNTTLLRYKKLLITYYDVRNKAITYAHNNLGYMSWFGVFTNTYKDKITDNTSDNVSSNLKLLGLDGDWNTALDKFVIECGGDYNIITKNAIDASDKACIEQFNKLARKYSAYAIKYANTDWKTLVTYLSAKVGSECLKYYIAKEPEHIAAIPEKEIYDIFDSRKILRETFEAEEGTYTPGSEEVAASNPVRDADVLSTVAELALDVDNVSTMSEKLYTAAKLKDFLKTIEDRIAEDPINEILLGVREKLFVLANKLSETSIEEVSELEVK